MQNRPISQSDKKKLSYTCARLTSDEEMTELKDLMLQNEGKVRGTRVWKKKVRPRTVLTIEQLVEGDWGVCLILFVY